MSVPIESSYLWILRGPAMVKTSFVLVDVAFHTTTRIVRRLLHLWAAQRIQHGKDKSIKNYISASQCRTLQGGCFVCSGGQQKQISTPPTQRERPF